MCEHADLIASMVKETQGIAANLLAYPMAILPSPQMTWQCLWDNAIVLREIVAFGDSDAISDGYASRYEAGKLLLLLFRIGLAIFDQRAERCVNCHSIEAESLVILYNNLVLASREMYEIDKTLNHDEWRLVIQHLAIRRMIWELPFGCKASQGVFRFSSPEISRRLETFCIMPKAMWLS